MWKCGNVKMGECGNMGNVGNVKMGAGDRHKKRGDTPRTDACFSYK